MRCVSPWRQEAEQVIRDALAEAQSLGLNPQATLRLVDGRYPFGPRANHPYDIWLDVRAKLVTGKQKVPAFRTAPPPRPPKEQMAFDLTGSEP